MSTCKTISSVLTCASLLLGFGLVGPAGADEDSGPLGQLPQQAPVGGVAPEDLLKQTPVGDPRQALPPVPDPGSLLPQPPPAAGTPSTPSKPAHLDSDAPARVVPTPRAKPAPRAGGGTDGPRQIARHHGSDQSKKPGKGRTGHRSQADNGSSSDAGASRSAKPKSTRVGDDAAGPRSVLRRVINRIPPQYRAALIALACLSAFLAFMFVRERRRSARVERQAKIDSLTRLPNRQAFELRLAQEWVRSGRYGRPLGLLLLDLDDFKQINDTKGHAAGDAVLREVAVAISSRIRVTDMAARLGGDEFVVICPETPIAGLESLASSLEHRLREESIPASVGVSEREAADGDPSDMVARADAAMYRRKQSAREDPDLPLPVLEPSLAGK